MEHIILDTLIGAGGLMLLLSITHTEEKRQHNVFFQKLHIFSLEQSASATDPKCMIKHDPVTTTSVNANKQKRDWYCIQLKEKRAERKPMKDNKKSRDQAMDEALEQARMDKITQQNDDKREKSF